MTVVGITWVVKGDPAGARHRARDRHGAGAQMVRRRRL